MKAHSKKICPREPAKETRGQVLKERMMTLVNYDPGYVNSHEETIETIAELAHAHYALGYTEAWFARYIRETLFLPQCIDGYDDIQPREREVVIAKVKKLFADHVINVALARSYETTGDTLWPNDGYREANARLTFRARDLLDVRMGRDAAQDLVLKVRTQLNASSKFEKAELLEDFLARLRGD
jgi:hypothetical protein